MKKIKVSLTLFVKEKDAPTAEGYLRGVAQGVTLLQLDGWEVKVEDR